MSAKSYSSRDVELMRMAIDAAKQCTNVETAYNVGAVICSSDKTRVLSTGYSRQYPGNTHAEECALMSLPKNISLKDAVMYTTMEPCSQRLSGKLPCVARILESGRIAKVFVGVREPPNFVLQCTGMEELAKRGVHVVHVDELETECRLLNKHLN
ncbi:hypothetical protein IWW38_000981 [Coemansia aciculifera]|uniref:Uncharacterized protein n=1 Tax=Coemansia aciculifera TaxID=417176 RepID=A0ACC1M7N1_9FUNG|nr:hypothetical protein IWW38_000981 [Coemansia aciculifera]